MSVKITRKAPASAPVAKAPAVKDGNKPTSGVTISSKNTVPVAQQNTITQSAPLNVGALVGASADKGTLSGVERTLKTLVKINPLSQFEWNTPAENLLSVVQERKAAEEAKLQTELAKAGKGAEIVSNLVSMTTEAAPNAIMSVAAAPLKGTQLAVDAVTKVAPTAMSALKTVAQNTASNPLFYTNLLQSVGSDYEYAKSNGASDVVAALYATGVGTLGAALETSGGIETLPAELPKSKNALLSWAKSAADEGKEEVAQGIISRSLEKMFYAKDNPLVSTKDKKAVINPTTIGEEFAYGTAVGGILGGGQLLNDVLLNRSANPLAPATGNAPQATTDSAATNGPQNAEFEAQPTTEKTAQIPAETATEDARTNTVGAASAEFFENRKTPYDRLVDQSTEFHPTGANARTDIAFEVPTKDFDGRYISRFVSNAMGAKVLSHETVETIEILTAEGLLSDDAQTNVETMAKAEKEIAKIKSDGAMERLRTAAYNGETSPKIIGMMETLLVDSEVRGDKSRTAELVYLGSMLSRNSGRSLQMLAYLRKMSPEYQLAVIDRVVDGINENIDRRHSKKYREKHGDSDIQIPEEVRQKYLAAENAEQRNEVIGEMQQYIADNMKSTLLEKWTAIRYTNMLGNFKTNVRNVAGNLGMRALAETNNAIVALAERVAGGKIGRTRSLYAGSALKQAAQADFDANKDAIVGGRKYADDLSSGDAFMQGVQDKRKILPPVFEQYRKATQWMMDNQYFGDTAFMRSAYSRFLGGYLKANGVTAAQFTDPSWQATHGKLIEEARTFATQQAKETTFRDNNAISDWVAKIGRRRDTPWFARMAAEGFSPFRRTPANILVRAEEYSPLGLVNATVKALQKARGAEVTGNDIVTSLSKSLTGTALFGLGWLLANTGWLRSSEDDEEQAAFDDLVGKQDYSLVLPDGTNLTVDWLTPTSITLFMGAQLSKILQDNDLSWKDVESVITSMAEPMLEMSMMSGVSDTLDDIKFAENNVVQLVASTALGYLTQGLTNTLLGQLERATQDTRKSTYVDKEVPLPDWMQREIGSASAKTPAWDFGQIDYIDAWGRTEDSIDNDFLRLSYELFSPAYINKADMDSVEAELQKVYDLTASTAVFPERAQRYIDVNGERRDLTADQYTRYAKSKGQKSYQYAKAAIATPAYKKMRAEDKADYIGKMYSYANYKAAKSIFANYEGTEEMQKFAEAEKQGFSPAEWYVIRNDINDFRDTETATRKEQVEDYIDEQDLTQVQKDWLFLWKYKETTLKDTPWH